MTSATMICNTNSHNKNTNNIGMPINTATSTSVVSSSSINPTPITTSVNEELRYHGTELVMLYDYKVRIAYTIVIQSRFIFA